MHFVEKLQEKKYIFFAHIQRKEIAKTPLPPKSVTAEIYNIFAGCIFKYNLLVEEEVREQIEVWSR